MGFFDKLFGGKAKDENTSKFTNQIFLVLENAQLAALEGKAKFGFWEKFDDTHTVVRIATSWATRMDEVEALLALM